MKNAYQPVENRVQMNTQEAIKWGIQSLHNLGYTATQSAPENILSTPWSSVYRFKTEGALFYLKQVPEMLALESDVIALLKNRFDADVPKIIAANEELNCFLMRDAGVRLHDFFQNGFQEKIFFDVIEHYVKTQIKTIAHIDLFLNLGVPDWRLLTLPSLYRTLISDEALLLNDGLSHDEIKKLISLELNLQEICGRLSQYNIPDAFGHGDFHDKNILIDSNTNQITIIDLGEVVITHPFFSLHNFLYRTKENFSLSDEQYRYIQIEALKHWISFENEANLFEILSIIQQCWSIHSVLGEYRLMQSVDQIYFQKLKREGRIANNFRHWISQNKI